MNFVAFGRRVFPDGLFRASDFLGPVDVRKQDIAVGEHPNIDRPSCFMRPRDLAVLIHQANLVAPASPRKQNALPSVRRGGASLPVSAARAP